MEGNNNTITFDKETFKNTLKELIQNQEIEFAPVIQNDTYTKTSEIIGIRCYIDHEFVGFYDSEYDFIG